jgi:hypothetical protein
MIIYEFKQEIFGFTTDKPFQIIMKHSYLLVDFLRSSSRIFDYISITKPGYKFIFPNRS